MGDADAETDDMLLFKLSVKQGVLHFDLNLLGLSSQADLENVLGVDFVRGDGVDDSKMVFYASLDSANQLLGSLTYVNETGRDDRLVVIVDDLGLNGGARRRDIDFIRLYVNNDDEWWLNC